MGLDKDFVQKIFSKGEDRVNRSIFVKPEELIEISDEDLRYFGEGIFYCLPDNEFVKNNKEKFKEGTDYIFVGKAVLKEKLASLKYEDIEKDMLKVIKK